MTTSLLILAIVAILGSFIAARILLDVAVNEIFSGPRATVRAVPKRRPRHPNF